MEEIRKIAEELIERCKRMERCFMQRKAFTGLILPTFGEHSIERKFLFTIYDQNRMMFSDETVNKLPSRSC